MKKRVHLNFERAVYEKISEAAEDSGMPISEFVETIMLRNVDLRMEGVRGDENFWLYFGIKKSDIGKFLGMQDTMDLVLWLREGGFLERAEGGSPIKIWKGGIEFSLDYKKFSGGGEVFRELDELSKKFQKAEEDDFINQVLG